MNILIFTNNTWDDTNSIGNTVSNFFHGEVWENDSFFNIYNRNSLPNNAVCDNYYRITLVDMIKNSFNRERMGQQFILSDKCQNIKQHGKGEQGFIDLMHKYSLNFVYSIANYVYRKKKWINSSFKNYIKNAEPDIFFAFLIDVAILKPMVEYLKNHTTTKIVLFISDNIYFNYKNKKLKREFEEIIHLADKLYGASNELCQVYGEYFNVTIETLYKGCKFDEEIKKDINKTIKFVYTGNLLYGRDDVLSQIALSIEKSNKKCHRKAILEIYTGTTITHELEKKLCISNASIIKGKRSYSEIKKIMNNADYNLVVESFEQQHIDYVKYSLSTKIIDCLQSGSCLVGIGPSSVSSLRYIKNIPGSHIVNQLNDLDYEIEQLIIHSKNIIMDSKKIRNFALKNHDLIINQKKIRDDCLKLIQ